MRRRRGGEVVRRQERTLGRRTGPDDQWLSRGLDPLRTVAKPESELPDLEPSDPKVLAIRGDGYAGVS